MIISELTIRHYGKMKNRTIVLKPGTNVITGDNETGKTTIASFIKAMLYGLDPADEEYVHFYPREDDGVFGGTLTVSDRAKTYVIERELGAGRVTFSMRDQATGEPVGDPEKTLEALLGNVTREQFEDTGFVCQESFSRDDGKFRPTREKSEEAEKAASRRESFMKGRAILSEKRAALLEKVDPAIASVFAETKRDMEERTAKKEALEKKLADGRDAAERAQNALKEETERAAKKNEERRAAKENDVREASAAWDRFRTDEEQKIRKKNTLGTFLLVVGLLILIAAAYYVVSHKIYSFDNYRMFIAIGAAVLGIAAFVFGIIASVKTYKIRKQACRDLNDETELRNALNEKKAALETYLSDRAAFDDKVEDREQKEETLSGILTSNKALSDEIRETEDEIATLTDKAAALEIREKEDRDLRREIRAIDIAIASFERLGNLNGTDVDPVAEGASDYHEGFVSKKAVISLKNDVGSLKTEDGEFLFSQLSTGTKHSALFAVRLARLDELDGGRKVPLILDDVFTNLDKGRMESVMKYLRNTGRQVILTACRPREQ